jgi:hypothetical protein
MQVHLDIANYRRIDRADHRVPRSLDPPVTFFLSHLGSMLYLRTDKRQYGLAVHLDVCSMKPNKADLNVT